MIANIHLLRGVAALMVVAHHMLYEFNHFNVINSYPQFGALGVDLFFVISGFIIVVVTRPDTRATDFLKKRFFRVVPLYWLATFVLLASWAAAFLLTGSDRSVGFGEILKSLLFIPYDPEQVKSMPVLIVGWTLYYEMFFYLIFAGAIALFTKRAAILAASFCLAFLVFIGQDSATASPILNFYTDPVILEFVWGMALGWLWTIRDEWMPAVRPFWSIPLLTVGTAMLLTASGHDPFTAGGGAALIIAAALLLEFNGKAVSTKITNFFGDISYSLYLFHTIAFYAAHSMLSRTALSGNAFIVVLTIFMAFLGVVWLSWLSFKHIEQPLGRFAKSVVSPQVRKYVGGRHDGRATEGESVNPAA